MGRKCRGGAAGIFLLEEMKYGDVLSLPAITPLVVKKKNLLDMTLDLAP